MTQHTNRLILKFRPYIWARTILYEYFCMSWATRIAAENTRHPPLAARLVGESFELSIKVLHILCQGPGKELKYGHSLKTIVGDIPALEHILGKLWGSDFDYVLNIMEGECNPSQVRYGASGGNSKRGIKIIPSGYAETKDVWTSTTVKLYEELMLSLGQAIWSNYPEGDRDGNPVERRIKITPSTGTQENPRPASVEEEIALQEEMFDPKVWAYILKAESTGMEIPYWGIIPMGRLNDPEETEYYVRARVSANMVVDVKVTKNDDGLSLGHYRITGQEDGEFRLMIYAGHAMLPYRGEYI